MPSPADMYFPLMDAQMSEARLIGAIRRLCNEGGLLMYHARDSRGSEPGLPDLIIVGPGGVIYRELKPQQGDLRWHQRRWFSALRRARQSCEIWRPSDWFNGRIQLELQMLKPPEAVQLALSDHQAIAA